MNLEHLKMTLQQSNDLSVKDTTDTLKVFSSNEEKPFWVLRKEDKAMDLDLSLYHGNQLDMANFFVTLGTTLMQFSGSADAFKSDKILTPSTLVSLKANNQLQINDSQTTMDDVSVMMMEQLMHEFSVDQSAGSDPLLSVLGLARAVERQNNYLNIPQVQNSTTINQSSDLNDDNNNEDDANDISVKVGQMVDSHKNSGDSIGQ